MKIGLVAAWIVACVLPAGAQKEARSVLDRSFHPRPPKPVVESVPDDDGFVPLPIIGGGNTTIADHPWQVGLLYSDVANNYQAQFCGGSLVNRWWVVTAAHCVEGFRPDEVDVLLGTGDLNVLGAGQRIPVAEVIVHPDYNSITSDSDIALLRLSQPAPASATPIPLIDESPLADPGVMATVSGWGDTTGNGSYSSLLRAVDLPVVSLATANASTSYAGTLTDNMLPAGYAAGGADSCQGDSGGPLTVPSPVGPGRMLAGVVSFGSGCAQANYYGIYTRVSNFRPFLLGHTMPNYAAWEAATGQIGELRDPDGDGWTRLDDFALPGRMVRAERTGGETIVSYLRPESAGEVTYTIERAPDLATPWTGVADDFRGSEEAGGGLVWWKNGSATSPAVADFFRLVTGTSDALATGARPLDVPGSADGYLDGDSEEHPDLTGHHQQVYRLVGPMVGTNYSVSLRSAGFDARLELLDETGSVLAASTSDAGLGRAGTDEVISFTPVAGVSYLLRATTEAPGEAGQFTIAIWSTSAYASLTPVVPDGGSVGASLSASDPYNPYYQPVVNVRYDRYRLDLSAVPAGTPVEVLMYSGSSQTVIDELVMVVDAETGKWFGIGDDDSTGSNPSAKVHFLPVPGVKYIAVGTSYAPTSSTRGYSMSATANPGAVGSVPLTGTRSETLNSADSYDAASQTYFQDFLLAAGTVGRTVRITQSSSQFDCYLEVLEASSLRVVASNDDFSGTNSRLDLVLRAGERYLVRATSYDFASGSYTLTTQLLP